MMIIPAIDIRGGFCVRLVKGDFSKETVYSTDPITVAKTWERKGAQMLHIVDLDGARKGYPVNFHVIKEIVKKVNIPIQVGGGIRNEKSIQNLLENGIQRIVLGTLVLENMKLLDKILGKYGQRIVVALDVKNGKLVKQGWVKKTGKQLLTTAIRLERLGVKRIIYTDILKDGTLTKPNFRQIQNLVDKLFIPTIVSGGISSIDDISKIKSMGIESVIIGKALYERKIRFEEAKNAN